MKSRGVFPEQWGRKNAQSAQTGSERGSWAEQDLWEKRQISRLSPREREQRPLYDRRDEGGLAQGQVQAPPSSGPPTMLTCVFF